MAIIYHYCNPGAFLSTIESRSLWLGNAHGLALSPVLYGDDVDASPWI
jgi:hypothetical protein